MEDEAYYLENEDFRQSDVVLMGSNDSATFVFPWGELHPEHARRILPDLGKGRSYHVATDRLIQRYLEELAYQLEVVILPFSLAKKKEGRTICLVFRGFGGRPGPVGYIEGLLELSTSSSWVITAVGALGHVRINVFGVAHYCARAKVHIRGYKPALDQWKLIDVSKHVWGDLSPNFKGRVHNWLQQRCSADGSLHGPVFRPAHPVKRRDSSGARLSGSDIVTLGLLAGMFSRGVGYSDFDGPIPFELVHFGRYLSHP